MTRVTQREIEQIAHLARLEIDPQALPTLTAQIEQILGYVSQLKTVDLTGALAPPWLEPRTILPLRKDEVDASNAVRDVEAMAPAFRDGFFVVPRVEAVDDE